MPDTKRLISEVAAENGIRVEPGDPLFALVTMNRSVLEESAQRYYEHNQKLIAEFALQLRDRRFGGSEHFQALWCRIQQPSEFRAHLQRILLLLAAYQHIRESAKRRIPHQLAKLDFLRVKTVVVLLGRETDGVMLGIDGLDENDARQVATARPARRLR